jgi:hypothetical protein
LNLDNLLYLLVFPLPYFTKPNLNKLSDNWLFFHLINFTKFAGLYYEKSER